MSKQIPWLRVFVEGVVIVGSILLAFGIQAWWDVSQERREASALIGGLLAEFRANEAPLDLTIAQHRRLAASAAGALEFLSGSPGPEVEIPDTLLFGLYVTTTYDATLGTLEEAQSSGQVGLIQNAVLRGLLGAWPGRLDDALEEQEIAQLLWMNRFHEVLGESVWIADLNGSPARSFLFGRPQEDPSASRSVPVTPGLANYASSRRRALNRSAEELTAMRTQLDSIVALLEAERMQ